METDWPAVSQVLPVIEREWPRSGAAALVGEAVHDVAAVLKSRYERLPDFVRLSKKYDPQGKFRNEFLERNVFG